MESNRYLNTIEELLYNFEDKGKMLAVAESCTGGYICHMLTNISGSSKVFERGVVCYSNDAKVELLGVKNQTIEQYGAVSEQVAEQLCRGIREISKVNAGVGITGIAGPTGGTPDKPVGLVYIGFSSEEECYVEKHIFDVDRLTFKDKVLEEVLEMLRRYIKK
jgi:nicotinamide-nucleotide amidase